MKLEKVCNDRIKEVCKKYNVPVTQLVFSGRLKAANGLFSFTYTPYLFRTAKTPDQIKTAIQTHKITISKHLIEFGEKAVLETLNHELAHHILVFQEKNIDHTTNFKKLCVELGGTMNESLAGYSFKEATNKNEWVSSKIGYYLKCTCGKPGCGQMHYVNNPRKSSLENFYCPVCKTKMKHWKKVEGK